MLKFLLHLLFWPAAIVAVLALSGCAEGYDPSARSALMQPACVIYCVQGSSVSDAETLNDYGV